MRADLVEVLRCPRTGQRLSLEAFETADGVAEYGLLTSEGGRYPVVAGIPIFTAVGDGAVAELRAGRLDRAVAEVFHASSSGSRWMRAATAMTRTPALRGSVRAVGSSVRRREVDRIAAMLRRPELKVTDILDMAFLRGGLPMADAHEYFRFRLGTPRHLVALSVLEALSEPKGLVADFGCGGGHLSWALSRRWPLADLLAVDLDFRLLLAARRLVGPGVTLICADIRRVPVATGALDVSLSSDVLTYVEDKWAAVREMERVLRPSGTLAITSVKDAAADHVFAGIPLSLPGWRTFVEHLDHRLIADDLILARYLDGKGLPVEDRGMDGTTSRLVTLLASRGGLDLTCDRALGDWPHARGELGVNPLYRATRGGDGATYERHLPGGVYAQDNPEVVRYQPATMRLDDAVLEAARRGEQPPALDPWVATTAILAYPDAYQAVRWPVASDDGAASP